MEHMKYLIISFTTLFIGSCSGDPKSSQKSYMNDQAEIAYAGVLPFDIRSAQLVGTMITEDERHAVLVWADSIAYSARVSHPRLTSPAANSNWLLLHWKQTDDPVWIGARIPGAYLYADHVQYDGKRFFYLRYNSRGERIDLTADEEQKTARLFSTIEYPDIP